MRLESYDLPNDWEWAKIGDFAKLLRGVSYKKDDASKTPKTDHLPILRANNINNILNFDDLVYVPSEKIKPEQIICVGDILISMSSGSKHLVGKTAQADNDYNASFGAFCGLIRINNEVDKRFVKFFFKSQNYRKIISHLSEGININNLRRDYIESMPIPLPPLETQKKIVEILEKAEQLKEWRVEADELADEYLKSVFFEMFGDPMANPKNWEIKKLDKISSKITDGTHKTPKYKENGVKFISAKNIKKNRIDWKDIKYIGENEHQKLIQRCNPEFGDILLTKSGSIGESTIIDVDFELSLFESLALIKYEREKVNGHFLKFLLNTNSIKHAYRRSIKGVSIKHLHLIDIRKLPIILPPIMLQNQFSEIVQHMETLKSYQSQSKQQIDNLFNTLMQKAFKGELAC